MNKDKQQDAALEAERVAYKKAVNAQTEHKLSASFLKGAEWGWQARAQLAAPAGVPDAEGLLNRLAEWCDKQPKRPWYGRTAGDMVRTFMACQPLAAAPSPAPAIYQCPRCATSMQVDRTAKPAPASDVVQVPRELLSELCDLAFDAAEHHRQAMGQYKKHRQAAIDSVVADGRALLNGGRV